MMLGTIREDGFRMKTTAGDALAWPEGRTIKLQQSYSVSFECDATAFGPLILATLFGPLAVLALEFSRINPHWYLDGGFPCDAF